MTTLLKNCRLISPDLDYPGASLLLAEAGWTGLSCREKRSPPQTA